MPAPGVFAVFRASACTFVTVLEQVADRQASAAPGPRSAVPEGHFEGQMAFAAADPGSSPPACASVLAGQRHYQGL